MLTIAMQTVFAVFVTNSGKIAGLEKIRLGAIATDVISVVQQVTSMKDSNSPVIIGLMQHAQIKMTYLCASSVPLLKVAST